MNLAKVIELYPEMFRKMCGFEYLDAFIEEVEKKGDFIDIEKKINLTRKQKQLELQHLVKAAGRDEARKSQVLRCILA